MSETNSTTPPARQAFPDPIPGIIPHGSICTLAGATGVGKTAFIASWIARWQQGKTICQQPTSRPTGIGTIVGDRRWQSHRQWFDAAGCAPLASYSLRDDPTFDWTALRDWRRVKAAFERCVDALQLGPGGLVVLDPLALFLPGKVNDYKDVALGLGTLDQVLQPRGLTCLGIFHQSKQINDNSQQYRRPQDRILGSAAQIGFSDTAMYLLGPDDLDQPYYGFGWVPHHAPAATFEFVRDGFGLFVPYTGSTNVAPRQKADLTRALQVLALIPAEDGITTGELWAAVQRALGVSRATFNRDLQRLREEGLIDRDQWGVIRRVRTGESPE